MGRCIAVLIGTPFLMSNVMKEVQRIDVVDPLRRYFYIAAA